MSALSFFSMLLLVLTVNAADFEPPKVVRAKGTCIVNGSYIDNEGWFFYNRPAYKLEKGSSLYKLIQIYCPEYIPRGEVCCTEADEFFDIYINQILASFSLCNACRRNIRHHFYAILCDPDQSLWMDPSPYLEYILDEGRNIHGWYMTAVNWYITKGYADDFFTSCKDVRYIGGDRRAMEVISGGAAINPSLWIDILSTRISWTTFSIIGNSVPIKSMEPYSSKVIPCNTVDVEDQCYCADCPATPCKLGPYDRRVMLIIKARNPTYDTFQPDGWLVPTNWTFGPVFNKSVLVEALYLQNNITDMAVPYTDSESGTTQYVTLNEICYKPMAPDNTNCSILSVLNYFQNSQENLEYVDSFVYDYRYHIFYCTRYGISLWPFRNPSSTNDDYFEQKIMSCLGAFGGPIEPGVVLGGVNSKIGEGGYFYDYQNATSLIITIPITSQQTTWSFAWQKAFLEYVGNFKGNYIDIEYYTV